MDLRGSDGERFVPAQRHNGRADALPPLPRAEGDPTTCTLQGIKQITLEPRQEIIKLVSGCWSEPETGRGT